MFCWINTEIHEKRNYFFVFMVHGPALARGFRFVSFCSSAVIITQKKYANDSFLVFFFVYFVYFVVSFIPEQ